MNEIYYEVDEYGNCYDECRVTGFMIGSVKCQECENCTSHSIDYCYVNCKAFYDAIYVE